MKKHTLITYTIYSLCWPVDAKDRHFDFLLLVSLKAIKIAAFNAANE